MSPAKRTHTGVTGTGTSSVAFFCGQNWLQSSAQWTASLSGEIKADFRDRHESILPSCRAPTISDFTMWLLRITSRCHVREVAVSQFASCKWLIVMPFNYVIAEEWRLDHKTACKILAIMCKIHTILEHIS